MSNTIITIDGYNNKKITYIIPEDAYIDHWSARTLNLDTGSDILTNVNIEVFSPAGIEVEEEEI